MRPTTSKGEIMVPNPRKSPPKPVAAANEDITSTAEEPIDTVETVEADEMPEISATKADEIQASMLKVAEQGLEQTRNAYERLRTAAEEATGSFETSYMAAAKGLNEFNSKAIDALKMNADATFDLMKALFGVKTLSEAITLQTEHARKQFEALTAQSGELAEIAKKAAAETAEPLKTSLAKTFGKAA
jgi:phasin